VKALSCNELEVFYLFEVSHKCFDRESRTE
jgi:hypothetical protein